METPIGTATTLDRRRFDEGWVDSGKVVTFEESVKSLDKSKWNLQRKQ